MNIKEFLGLNAYGKDENGRTWTHEEKYGKIVETIGLENCIPYLPATKKEIIDSLENDPHLNTIPLSLWDNKHPMFKQEFFRIGIRTLSLSDTVCTLKEAARRYARS